MLLLIQISTALLEPHLSIHVHTCLLPYSSDEYGVLTNQSTVAILASHVTVTRAMIQGVVGGLRRHYDTIYHYMRLTL